MSRRPLPTYLLKPEPDKPGQMERWRKAAESQGISFAAYVRAALDATTEGVERGDLPPWLAPRDETR